MNVMIDFYSRFYKLVLTFLVVGTAFVFSQDCNLKLTVKIVDLHENSPIEGALVEVLDTHQTAISSVHGVFVFENQC